MHWYAHQMQLQILSAALHLPAHDVLYGKRRYAGACEQYLLQGLPCDGRQRGGGGGDVSYEWARRSPRARLMASPGIQAYCSQTRKGPMGSPASSTSLCTQQSSQLQPTPLLTSLQLSDDLLPVLTADPAQFLWAVLHITFAMRQARVWEACSCSATSQLPFCSLKHVQNDLPICHYIAVSLCSHPVSQQHVGWEHVASVE